MNPSQLTQQIVSALAPANFKWPSGALEPVLSRVVVGPVADGYFQHDFVSPCAVLHLESGKDHDEHPADVVLEQKWTLYMFASNASEQSGSAAVVGGNRAELGSSRGRGLLEIEPLVKAQLFNSIGLVARPRTTGGGPTAVGGKLAGLVAERALEVVATHLPSFPDFAPVRQLVATPTLNTFTVVDNAGLANWTFSARYSTTATGVVLQISYSAGSSFAVGATAAISAANLAAAINALNPAQFVATSSGAVVTVTAAGTNFMRDMDVRRNGGGVGAATSTTPTAPPTFVVANNVGLSGWSLLVTYAPGAPGVRSEVFGGNVAVGVDAATSTSNLVTGLNGDANLFCRVSGPEANWVRVYGNTGVAITAISATQGGGSAGCVTAAQATPGAVTLAFAAATPRYDLVGYTWVRAAGGVAPATPAGGTFVANPSATGFSDAPGSGTWSYSVFWSFDVTRDPSLATGVTPVAPNAWSSYQTAQDGLVYLPAQAAGLVV